MEEKRSAFKKMTEVRASAPASTERHTQVIFTDQGAGVTLDIRYQSTSDCGVRRREEKGGRSGRGGKSRWVRRCGRGGRSGLGLEKWAGRETRHPTST